MTGAVSALASLRGDLDGALHDTGSLLSELVEAPPPGPGTSEESPLGPVDALLSEFFGEFRALRRRQDDSRLSVAVLALTKSGDWLLWGTGWLWAAASETLGTGRRAWLRGRGSPRTVREAAAVLRPPINRSPPPNDVAYAVPPRRQIDAAQRAAWLQRPAH